MGHAEAMAGTAHQQGRGLSSSPHTTLLCEASSWPELLHRLGQEPGAQRKLPTWSELLDLPQSLTPIPTLVSPSSERGNYKRDGKEEAKKTEQLLPPALPQLFMQPEPAGWEGYPGIGSWAQASPEEALKSVQALKGRQSFQDPRLGRGRDGEGSEGNQNAESSVG